MTPTAPTTPAIDQNYFKSPTESVGQYNTRISQYNASKPTQTPTATNTPSPTEGTQQKPSTPSTQGATTGTPPQGMTQDDYNSFKQANPNLEPTAEDVNKGKMASDLTDAKAQRAQADADYQTQAKQVHDTITNIQNGTTPLNPGQQAQIDGLKQQFQVLIDAQKLQNTGASGLGNVRGYQKGAAEYDPTFQVKTIGAIVNAGQQKIADLNTKMASAVASLTQSFHDNDIKAVTDAYKIYSDAAKEHADTLQKTIDDAQAAIKNAQEQDKNAQDEADKQAQYGLDVAKFQQTGDQNAFDNALKSEQEKFNEQNQQALRTQASATLAESARHNRAEEGIQAFNAGMGAGGGQNMPNIPSAQIGTNGPDPASQKAVLDNITKQYGPMTAVAIKGLADYSMNPADWSVRSAKGGMNREQAVTLAKLYDPTYSDAQYSVRASYMKNLASSQTGTIGAAVNAANKSLNHLTAYVTTMGQLTSGPGAGPNQTNIGNTIGNFLTLDPARRQSISAANTEGLGVAEELAKFFKGSGTVDVASIDAWKSQLSTNATPAQVKGTTQGAITLLTGQLETLAEQYTSTMGKAPATDFLGPSARASLSSLKDQGYEVNIPGIGYSNKDAYLQNGGSKEALSSAYQTLVDANDPNNPPTPENVLELAQMQ